MTKKKSIIDEKLLTERMLAAALWRTMQQGRDGGLTLWRVAQFVGGMYEGNDFEDFLCEIIHVHREVRTGIRLVGLPSLADQISPVSQKILKHRARKVARYPKK